MYPNLRSHFAVKFFSCLLLAGLIHTASAQPMNNEWIDFTKTYYKFKIAKNGVVRINQPTLAANSLGSVNAQNFQLFRNGVQVPIYTSLATGVFGASDYIEFYGVINDGKPDKVLYKDASLQLNDRVSLETDSSAYFLTYSTTQTGLRYTTTANNVAGNTLSPQSFFTYTEKYDFKEMVNRGFADPSPGEYIYSSSYDTGEMLTTNEIYSYLNPAGAGYPDIYKRNFYPYTGAGAGSVTVKAAAMGTASNVRNVEFRLGSNLLGTMNLSTFQAKAETYSNLPISFIPTGQASYFIKNLCSNDNDRIAVSFIDITYPRLFKFNNQTSFEFELAANSAGQYIEITDFSRGSATPVLYDLTNNRRYVADVNGAGTIRFALPGTTTTTSYVLLSEDASAVTTVSNMQQRNFINYGVSDFQGNYIIISNSLLNTPVNGNNPVELYRAYRGSAVGGAYNARIYDIDQLEDQFAFGIKKHPLSVKNFLRFARQNFSLPPSYALIIGKGASYQEYRFRQQFSYAERLNMVPTFGYPGSDIMLASNGTDPFPATPIGRLSVISGQEIIDYLNKVKTYEAFQISPSQTQGDKLWTKNIVHVVGASDAGTAYQIAPLMDDYKATIQDTLFGGNVITLNKHTTTTASNISSSLVNSLFQNGISLLTYFGHSSATALDYNLEDPSNYNNPGKYPMFMLLGCNAGNFFDMDTSRLSLRTTISEKYVLAADRGSIGLIASTSYGLVGNLDVYSRGFYQSVGVKSYGQSVGKNMQDAVQYSINYSNNIYGSLDFYTRLHAEQQNLHGDPAIKINNYSKPDYSVEESNIYINPTLVSVAENSFKVKVYHYNLGRAISDSITVQVKRQYPVSDINPSGLTQVVYNKKIKATRFVDSLELDLPVVANRDKGTNKIIVSVETENRIAELSETNNTASRDVNIYEDEMRPVYPYNFAIVNRQGINLVATTSSPVLPTARAYRMEMDTTELFNSPFKITRNITTAGGISEFDPRITFADSTVYYWRLASVPATGSPDRWNTSSFVYLASSPATGYNQSHVFQHLKSTGSKIYIDSTSRKWNFTTHLNNLFVTHSVYPVSGTETTHFSVSVNGDNYIRGACQSHSIIFNVFDPVTFKPWVSDGRFGSRGYSCGVLTSYNFEWDDRTLANRDSMMRFMDAIPSNYYVVVRKILDQPYANEVFAPIWKSDEQVLGAGNSLYQRFKDAGFAQIDSFNRPRTFVMLYRKGDPSFTKVKMSDNLERIQLNTDCPTPDTLGYITSPLFGPARSWKSVQWRGNTDGRTGDYPLVSVIGVNNSGNETLLYNLDATQQDFDLSSVDSTRFPYIRLQMRNADSINGTAYNLRYWRLLYNPVPEGAMAANLLFRSKDSMELGDNFEITIPFKNISNVAFRDSIKVKAVVLDQSNVQHVIPITRKKALQPGDTTTVTMTLNTKNYPGVNNLYLEMNPVDSAQPEQYHFNNFIYRDFYVRPDNYNPLMDVTFDGLHILNKDIVSSRPHIQIKLKDESQYLLLNDTSLMKLTLRYPDGSLHSYRFGTDTLRFTPATAGADNTATIDFTPALDQDSDQGYYELTVTGKDRQENAAGPSNYNVSFQVFNKPMISNLFNYPNPFTTSTAFVFTITGNEIPQEFKIQILTVTGKIVREITKPELGPLNIGRNITEYKWDGTDQYGSKLANGVYLYRVVTSLNGKKMDQFRINDNYDQSAQDQTDKYFNKGYGKMYLMR